MATRKRPAKSGVQKELSPWEQERLTRKKADLDRRITEFLDWTKNHPSVWDNPPR